MDSLTEETKTILHHILHKHKFYQMELNSYSIFLSMLNQEPTLDCIAIQQRTFRGIVNIVQTYRYQSYHPEIIFLHLSTNSVSIESVNRSNLKCIKFYINLFFSIT